MTWEAQIEAWLDRQQPERVQQREEDAAEVARVEILSADLACVRNVISTAIRWGWLGPNADVWSTANDNWLEWRLGR